MKEENPRIGVSGRLVSPPNYDLRLRKKRGESVKGKKEGTSR